VQPERELYAPTLWRSQVLSKLYESVRRGEIGEDAARERLDVLN
jgi:hypothetical protein